MKAMGNDASEFVELYDKSTDEQQKIFWAVLLFGMACEPELLREIAEKSDK